MSHGKHNGPVLSGVYGSIVILLLAGCSGNSMSTGTTTSPDFTGASTATGTEVSASMGSMSMSSSSAGGTLADAQKARIPHSMVAGGGVNGCGTVVVNSSNAQGLFTDETITYTLPACEFTGVLGSDSLAITGSLELMRPDPGVLNFSSKDTNLEYAYTTATGSSSQTRNGTRQLTATTELLNESNDITTNYVNSSVGAGTLNNSLVFSFTPASGTSLGLAMPLPNGTVEVNGTVGWTGSAAGATADSFTITTITPLAYDAACGATSASPFDSGQLKVVIADGSVKTYAHITWTDCGAPVVTVI